LYAPYTVGIGSELYCNGGRNVVVEVILVVSKGVRDIGDGIESRGMREDSVQVVERIIVGCERGVRYNSLMVDLLLVYRAVLRESSELCPFAMSTGIYESLFVSNLKKRNTVVL
jgi:hypothetical protein